MMRIILTILALFVFSCDDLSEASGPDSAIFMTSSGRLVGLNGSAWMVIENPAGYTIDRSYPNSMVTFVNKLAPDYYTKYGFMPSSHYIDGYEARVFSQWRGNQMYFGTFRNNLWQRESTLPIGAISSYDIRSYISMTPLYRQEFGDSAGPPIVHQSEFAAQSTTGTSNSWGFRMGMGIPLRRGRVGECFYRDSMKPCPAQNFRAHVCTDINSSCFPLQEAIDLGVVECWKTSKNVFKTVPCPAGYAPLWDGTIKISNGTSPMFVTSAE